jgi:hypothetical protein
VPATRRPATDWTRWVWRFTCLVMIRDVWLVQAVAEFARPPAQNWPTLATTAASAGSHAHAHPATPPAATSTRLRVAAFTQWCAKHDKTPDSAARAQYMAQLDAADDPAIIPWPPGRNQRCWCGSERNTKSVVPHPDSLLPSMRRRRCRCLSCTTCCGRRWGGPTHTCISSSPPRASPMEWCCRRLGRPAVGSARRNPRTPNRSRSVVFRPVRLRRQLDSRSERTRRGQRGAGMCGWSRRLPLQKTWADRLATQNYSRHWPTRLTKTTIRCGNGPVTGYARSTRPPTGGSNRWSARFPRRCGSWWG